MSNTVYFSGDCHEDSRGTKLNKVWIDQRRRSLKAWSSPRTRVETGGKTAGGVNPQSPCSRHKADRNHKPRGMEGIPTLVSVQPLKIMWPGYRVSFPFLGLSYSRYSDVPGYSLPGETERN